MATHTHHTPHTDVEVQEEQPKTVEVPPEPSVGVTEKRGGPLEVLPDKETKVGVEGIEGAEAVSEEVEIPADVPEVEAKYGGQSEKVEKPEEVVSAVDVKEKEVQEEQPKTVEVPPEPSFGATEKPGGPLEVLPDKETKVEVEGIEGGEAVSEEVEIPVDVPEVEAKYGGQSEKVEKPEEVVSAVDVEEKVLSEAVEPKRSVEGGHVEEEGADKFDDSILLKEEKACIEEEPSKSSEQGSITTQETRTDHQEEADGKASVPEVVEEKAGSRDESKESGVADVIENTLKSTQKMKENIAKDVDVEAKQVEAITDVKEPVKEPEESGLEVKERVNVETSVDKLEEEKAEEIAKSDAQNQELASKKGDETETKTSKDLPKEVLSKPTQKQSNNIISKVKKLLVQAKKAIIGKSPSSKSSGTKGDIKVK